MTLPLPTSAWSSGEPITVAHDFGMNVSVPLLALALLGNAAAFYDQERRRARRKLLGYGAALQEGRVIVDVTRIAERRLQTAAGEDLDLEDGPLALDIGERGHVLGTFVRGGVPRENDYRDVDRSSVGRLLPIGGQYAIVPALSIPGYDYMKVSLIATVPCTVMTLLALIASDLPVGGVEILIELAWVSAALVVGTIAVLIVAVPLFFRMALKSRAERLAACGRGDDSGPPRGEQNESGIGEVATTDDAVLQATAPTSAMASVM